MVVEVSGLHGLIVAGLVTTVLCWLRLVWLVYSPVEEEALAEEGQEEKEGQEEEAGVVS